MSKREIPPIHPGEILKEEILEPRKITQTKLSQGINVPLSVIREICQKKRNIDAEIALRLGTYFSISAQFWMNLQQHYDLEVSKDLFEKQIKKEVKPISSNPQDKLLRSLSVSRKTSHHLRKHL